MAYYSANGTPQQLVKAQVALYNITGWPSFEVPSVDGVSASPAYAYDGTPYGRRNLIGTLGYPDTDAHGWTLVGLIGDALPVAGLFVGASEALYAYFYQRPRWYAGEITEGDYVMAYFYAVPYLGSVLGVSINGVGPQLPVHWAEPRPLRD